MFCGKCGSEIPAISKFCPKCGSALAIERDNVNNRQLNEKEKKPKLRSYLPKIIIAVTMSLIVIGTSIIVIAVRHSKDSKFSPAIFGVQTDQMEDLPEEVSNREISTPILDEVKEEIDLEVTEPIAESTDNAKENYEYAYNTILEKYKKFVNRGDASDEEFQKELDIVYSVYDPNELNAAYSYAYYDVDSNGIDELFIRSDLGGIIDVYSIKIVAKTLVPVRAFAGFEDYGFWARNGLYITQNGFLTENSSGAWSGGITAYALDGYAVKIIDSISWDIHEDVVDLYKKDTITGESKAIVIATGVSKDELLAKFNEVGNQVGDIMNEDTLKWMNFIN
ncbi:zinc ribbon domain-containing protein [Lachnospiraceae bacterium ZAX-1]